jgi:hypothetical protein
VDTGLLALGADPHDRVGVHEDPVHPARLAEIALARVVGPAVLHVPGVPDDPGPEVDAVGRQDAVAQVEAEGRGGGELLAPHHDPVPGFV